jgi:peptidoglycan hydrolase-like protein with peptidoglycan-binding domain
MTSRHVATRRLRLPVAIGAVVLAAGAFALATHRAGASGTRDLAASGHTGRAGSATARRSQPAAPTTTAPPPPLALVGASPASGAADVAPSAPVVLRFSEPIAQGSPMPSVTPAIAGTWSGAGTSTLVFQPSARLTPYEQLSVTVPAGSGGVLDTAGSFLPQPVSDEFTVAGASTLRLQQLLAELGYLPVAFDLAGSTTSSSSAALASEGTTPSTVSLAPEQGQFVWRFSNIPAQLAAAWQPGTWNTVTEGAVMAFEAEHGLAVDGEPGPLVWGALLQAVADRDVTTAPYDEILVTETEPETLYVWRDGTVIDQSLANTGVPGGATPLGTWPVYLRYASTTMTGTNPNGTHYSDPGVPDVAYFNGSDAVHGFPRASYGFPQSDGCVELPIVNAAVVYGTDPDGTLVTVTTGNLAAELGVSAPASATSTAVG